MAESAKIPRTRLATDTPPRGAQSSTRTRSIAAQRRPSCLTAPGEVVRQTVRTPSACRTKSPLTETSKDPVTTLAAVSTISALAHLGDSPLTSATGGRHKIDCCKVSKPPPQKITCPNSLCMYDPTLCDISDDGGFTVVTKRSEDACALDPASCGVEVYGDDYAVLDERGPKRRFNSILGGGYAIAWILANCKPFFFISRSE